LLFIRTSIEVHEPFRRKFGLLGRGVRGPDARQELVSPQINYKLPRRGQGSGTTLLSGENIY